MTLENLFCSYIISNYLPDTVPSFQQTTLGVHWTSCFSYFVNHQKTTNENLNRLCLDRSPENSQLKQLLDQ